MSGTCGECGEVKWEVCLCSEPTEGFPDNAAQAQEIDELKAYVNELREALQVIAESAPRGTVICSPLLATTPLAKTPAQSLSAHDAAIEEDAIKDLILLCEAEKVGANEFDDIADIAWDDAVTSCMNAIRNMPRK